MYSYEERIKAVQLYIKYDGCIADTIRELRYIIRSALVRWYKEYQEHGDSLRGYERWPSFTLAKRSLIRS